jgi:hypothetical protein
MGQRLSRLPEPIVSAWCDFADAVAAGDAVQEAALKETACARCKKSGLQLTNAEGKRCTCEELRFRDRL